MWFFLTSAYRRGTLCTWPTVKREMADARVIVMDLLPIHEEIALIAVGLSNKEIAQRLNIAADTVKSHVRNVMDKLALHSRLQIAAYAHSHDDWKLRAVQAIKAL